MNTVANTVLPYPKPVHPKAPFSFRHHVLPPLFGILLFLGIIGWSNAQWLQAQAEYYFTKPANQNSYIVGATAPNKDSTEIQIPSINVDAPVQYEPSTIEWKIQLALRNGPDHYGATAMPGQAGNTVIIGHSSGQPWAPGNYKFVFTMLDKMKVGDKIFLDYKGTRYIYRVGGTKVIQPTDMSVLAPTKTPQLTLITCTPVGTSKNRRVITAAQIYPNPDTATPMDATSKLPLSGTDNLPQ
jgi:LPXTG-site transpeptidase (sortase) family protein